MKTVFVTYSKIGEKKMLKIDDYKIVYLKEINEIAIGLPHSIVRTKEVSNEELALILLSAMAVLEKQEKENETN